MIPLCGVLSLVMFLVYGVTGVRLSARMLKYGKTGPPTGLAVYRRESYTQEGQRLLKLLLRGWVFGLPFAVLLLGLLGGALCKLAGWQPANR